MSDVNSISQNWQTLDVGAGGFITGIDISPNGTMVARTDTYGAYIWNGIEWQQLITSTSMPAAFVTPNSNNQGVYEIQIAPSNSNILYMSYEGYVFKTTNDGSTWTETSFAPVIEGTSDTYRSWGQKMAIDPSNSNVVYVGTPENGLFVTTNGGTTWQNVSAVPVSQTDSNGDYPGITGIVFDPALGSSGGATNTIFAASYGNGVYESTNAGASWKSIGGPADVVFAAVSSKGVYYATDGTDLWSYQNNSWTELLSNSKWGIQSVAINPSNPNELVAQASSGQIEVSYNGGQTWSGYDANYSLSASDIPWLGATGSYMTASGIVFNPQSPNELISSAGVGVWTTNVPTSGFTSSTEVNWASQSVGIEQLVANEIIVPPGGNPVLASWDRPFFYISNETAFPSSYSPNTGNTLTEGWSVDYASSNPSFLVGIADNWGTEQSGYSTNGGQSWTPFPTFIPGAGSSFIGGTIAASSPTDIVWAPAGGEQPYYTLNGGETWNPINLPGVSSWSGFDTNAAFDARTVTADRVLPNTLYLYYAGEGVYQTTNGGASWTQVYSGQITPYSNYNAELQSVPGEAGNLFFTGGPQSGYSTEPFMFSSNGGAAWTAIPNVTEVNCFGFGAAAPGQAYPSIYIVGDVNSVYGIWQSTNEGQSWTQIGTYPTGDLNEIKTISGDPNDYGQVYVGFAGSGYAYLSATPAASTAPAVSSITAPVVSSIAETPPVISTDSVNSNNSVTLIGTAAANNIITVFDGQTELGTVTANANGSWTYTTGTLGNGAQVFTVTATDATGNTTSSISIDPVIGGQTLNASSDDAATTVNSGHMVTINLNLPQSVTVIGTPSLQLNDGDVAIYTGGSGTNALTFTYAVLPTDNISDLQVTGLNLPNGSSISGLLGTISGDLSLTINSATTPATVVQEISGLYVGLYGTAATEAGLQYWIKALGAFDPSVTSANAAAMPISAADAAFLGEQFVSTQASYFSTQYGNDTDSQFVAALYQNFTNSGGTPVGLQYWAGLLQSTEAADGGNLPAARASVAAAFVHDVLSDDLSVGANALGLTSSEYATLVAGQTAELNKNAVALFYATETAVSGGSILNYTTESSAAFAAAQSAVSTVTNDTTTATVAITGIANAVVHQDLTLV